MLEQYRTPRIFPYKVLDCDTDNCQASSIFFDSRSYLLATLISLLISVTLIYLYISLSSSIYIPSRVLQPDSTKLNPNPTSGRVGSGCRTLLSCLFLKGKREIDSFYFQEEKQNLQNKKFDVQDKREIDCYLENNANFFSLFKNKG